MRAAFSIAPVLSGDGSDGAAPHRMVPSAGATAYPVGGNRPGPPHRRGLVSREVRPDEADEHVLEIDGHEVTVSSPGKVFFPERGETKLDLVELLPAPSPSR